MRREPNSVDTVAVSGLAPLVCLAGVVAVVSGLVGGYVWLVDLADRSDGDSLRWGFWHNPFMQFPPFNEAFLDVSLWVLLACSAAAGLGGLALLVPRRWGVWLVTWQARVSVVVNAVTAFFIAGTMSVFATNPWGEWHLGGAFQALVLRVGAVAVDLALWGFLSGKAVGEFFDWRSEVTRRGFEVVTGDSRGAA
jgi:hypothetical protein